LRQKPQVSFFSHSIRGCCQLNNTDTANDRWFVIVCLVSLDHLRSFYSTVPPLIPAEAHTTARHRQTKTPKSTISEILSGKKAFSRSLINGL